MGLGLLIFPGGRCQDYHLQQIGTCDTPAPLTREPVETPA